MKIHVQKPIAVFLLFVLCTAMLCSVASAVVVSKVGPVDLGTLRTIRFNYAADPVDMGIYEIVEDKENHCLRIKEIKSGFWVVDAEGNYPYTPAEGDVPEEPGQAPAEDIAPPSISRNTFLDVRSLKTNTYNVVTYDALSTAVMNINNDGTTCDLRPFGNYYAIWHGDYKVYCNSSGQAYVALKDQSATDIKYDYIDNSTNAVIKDSQILDVENGIFNFIDDSGEKVTLNIGSLYYDASTHTYTANVYDTDIVNNTYIYNYYTYNITYNYQYTYVNYIGASAEYQKNEYEYYYELPDGRSSADLTPEDLAGISLDFNVVNYDREKTDTHTRSLYHFDGNLHDDSYYNASSSFTWNQGASITYMESNAFEGCLYLDTLPHSFTLGSNTPDGDGTLQFRMYCGGGDNTSFTVDVPMYYKYSGVYTPGYTNGDSSYFRMSFSCEDNKLSFSGLDWSIPASYGGVHLATNSKNLPFNIPFPVGSWIDLSFSFAGDYLYIFCNGVCVSMVSMTGYPGFHDYSYSFVPAFSRGIRFDYGAGFNFCQLDELRIVDFGLYTTNYTSSPVPFDTNNVFVLPKVGGKNYLSNSTFSHSSVDSVSSPGISVEHWDSGFVSIDSSLTAISGGVSISNPAGRYLPFFQRMDEQLWKDLAGKMVTLSVDYSSTAGANFFTYYVRDGVQYFSSPFGAKTDGQRRVESVSFLFPDYFSDAVDARILSIDCYGSGVLNLYGVKLELGDKSTLASDRLTVAVMSDIPVNGYRVGGVRPTFPAKGLVWFPVEKSRITDCQIYNGSYWESVECRLWTGVRWIPLWAFDVFTLADCFDIADGGVLPPITSETGFWGWWQKEWTSFRKWLTENGGGIIGGGSGSGSSFWTKIKDAFTDGLAKLIEALFDMVSTVLKTLLSVVTDLLSSVFDFLTDTVLASITGFFASFKDMAFFEFFIQVPASEPDPDTGAVVPPVVGLPSDVTTVFAFFSGVIMLLPAELRALLFFGIAALILISVFKLVKS